MKDQPQALVPVDVAIGARIAELLNKTAFKFCEEHPRTSATDVWLAGMIYTAEVSVVSDVEFDDIWAAFAQIYEQAKRNHPEKV